MMRKVRAGEKVVFPAAWQNAIADLVNESPGPFRETEREYITHGPFVWLVNNTSLSLCRGSILGIGSSFYDSTTSAGDFRTKPTFYGNTPTTATYWNRPAVLLQSIAPGYVGLAQIGGAIAVQLIVNNVNHKWADVDGSTATLSTYATGSCKVLSSLSTTGLQWALVELGKVFKGPLKGTTDAQITKGNSGTVSIINGAGTDLTYDVSAFNPFATVAASKKVHIFEVENTTNPYYELNSAECA